MLDTISKSDMKILLSWVLIILFLIWLMYFNSKNKGNSYKYKKLDYVGSFICAFFAGIAHILKIFRVSDIQGFVGVLSLWGFLFLVFLSIYCLWSWIINVHYRKEINDDTSYRFWVSFFLWWWILVFYLLAEFFRY